jgi:hypothetical protein
VTRLNPIIKDFKNISKINVLIVGMPRLMSIDSIDSIESDENLKICILENSDVKNINIL